MENNREPIVQNHNSRCGAACLAFALDSNYPEALKLFENGDRKAENIGFYCKEMVEILNKMGLKFEYKYVKGGVRNEICADRSIVFIKRSKKYPSGHYLCRYKNLWMDPWINLQRNKNIEKAKAGFRKRLPGKAIYAIIPK